MARSPLSVTRTAALLTVALMGMLALAGCTTGAQTGALPPVIVDLNTIDGTTVNATVGDVIDLTGDDKTYAAWTADIDDDSIVSFTPGKDDGSAQFNPGLQALAEGSTAVTLDNSESGDTVTFTIAVTVKE